MALVFTSGFYGTNYRMVLIVLFFSVLTSCDQGKKVYLSDCDGDRTFKRVTFNHLLDSLNYYDQKYVEITGTYEEGKGKSAIYNDSTLVKTDNRKAFWINFTQDCELYLKGTNIGLFEYNNGRFTQINNKQVRIRGKLDVHNQGYLKQYRGCIDHISLIEL